GQTAGSQKKRPPAGVPARPAEKPIFPLLAIAGVPRKLAHVVGPMPVASPTRATVVTAPANGRRKIPVAGSSIESAQFICVVGVKGTPKLLARAASSAQNSRPLRSGTASPTRTSVVRVPVPGGIVFGLQLPSPPTQRKIPASPAEPPVSAARKTTSPASVIV